MSRKMLIKPFTSIESAATATHNWRRRQMLRAGASSLIVGLAGSFGLPREALASSVLGVRVWPARDYTRVTIESDQPLATSQQLLQGPDRLVVDLNGLDLDQALRDLVSKITPNDPQIRTVRVGQFQPHVVRLVFDLKDSVKPQVFSLPPVGTYRYRLVLDLYPTVAPDPLMELLAETERKEKRLNDSDQRDGALQQAPAPLAGPAMPPSPPSSPTSPSDSSAMRRTRRLSACRTRVRTRKAARAPARAASRPSRPARRPRLHSARATPENAKARAAMA
jgi:N-acetylmuramoyl-L-alanine amidase